jgi:hypothetical protein
MESDQVHFFSFAVSGDFQQIIHAFEPRFTSQIVRHIGDGNRLNRIHDDVALVHTIATSRLYVGTRPDTNAASDSPESDTLAKAFGKYHMEPHNGDWYRK